MSKWAADENEPSVLERDKDDQSKYYLNYTKPFVLVMKRKNRDVAKKIRYC